MKMIKILQCLDSSVWYSNLVGKTVPLLRYLPDGYLSRESGGFSNVVLFDDGEIVDG